MAPKTKHYFSELPENYISDYVIDASSKKTGDIVKILFLSPECGEITWDNPA